MSARLRVGLIGSGDNNTNTLLRLLVEQGIHIVYTLTPKDISETHINEKSLDVWLLDLDDAHWHNNLDELMDHSNVPIFFNEHQSIEQQSHVEYWVRNLISRMEELADDIEMPNSPNVSVEKAIESASSNSALAAKEKPLPKDATADSVSASDAAASSTSAINVVSPSDTNQTSARAITPNATSPAEPAANSNKTKTAEMHHIAFNAPPALPSDQLTSMPTKVDVDLLREMEELESFLLDKDPAAKVDSFKPLEPIRLHVAPNSDSSVLEVKNTHTPTSDNTVEPKPAATPQTAESKADSVATPSHVDASTPSVAKAQTSEPAVTIADSKSESSDVATKAPAPANAKAAEKHQTPDRDMANPALAKTIAAAQEQPKSKLKKESIEDLLKAAKTELRGQMAPPSVRSEQTAQILPNASVNTNKQPEISATKPTAKTQAPRFDDTKNSDPLVVIEQNPVTGARVVESTTVKPLLTESVLDEPAISETLSTQTSALSTHIEIPKSDGKANELSKSSHEQIVLPTFELDLGFIDESVIDQRLIDSDAASSSSDANTDIAEATLDATLDSATASESNIAFALPTLEEDSIPALAMELAVDIPYESMDDARLGSAEQDELALLPTLEKADFTTEAFDAIEFEPVAPDSAESFVVAATVGSTQSESKGTEPSVLPTLTAASAAEETLPEIELAVPMLESVAMGAEFEELAPFKPNETPIVAQKKLPCDLWIVGASLGGPAALKRFFGSISEPLPVCFLIAQHIDPHFLPVLGKIVEGANPFYKVEVLTRPGLIEPGTILLAPVEKRLWFLDGAQVVHSPHSWTPPYSPSINDVLLDVAKAYPSQTHTVIFSGMGEDGVDGAKSIHQAGGHVWVQESESCASAVMPDAIFNTGIVSLRDTPEKLAQALMKRYLDKSQSQHG